MVKMLKKNLQTRYKDFSVPESIINEAINSAENKDNYINMFFDCVKYIDNVLVEKCVNDIDLEIQIIDKYREVSFPIIHKYGKYFNNKDYEDAIEKCLTNYDSNKTLKENILKEILKEVKDRIDEMSLNELIDKSELFELLDEEEMSENDYKLIELLFSNNDLDEISNKYKVKKDYLLYLKNKALEIYKDNFDEFYNEKIKFTYKM